ncbi:MAG: hypothetical protein AAF485_12675 [Chloroflexota bacterium]
MIAQTFRGPHNLYRRYQGALEGIITAIGLAVLVTLFLYNMPVYPVNWVVVIGVAIGLLGVRWPLLAYAVAAIALTYPIYTINLYLGVLFIAVTALGHRIFVHYLGATILVLATPLLAQYHLHWLVPILGGLWWGGVSGAWVGAMAAVIGKLLGGMAGLNIDWLILAGQSIEMAAIELRFQDSNSLETLLLLIEPFATTSTMILYNLLQIIGWAVAGGFVGSLASRRWVKYRTPWSVLVLTAGGGLILLATHVALPYWLQEAMTPDVLTALQDPTGPLFSLIIVIVVGTTITSLRESLELPVAPPRLPRRRRQNRNPLATEPKLNPVRLFGRTGQSSVANANLKRSKDRSLSRQPVPVPHTSELPEWEPPKDESGLIMLEID